MQKKEVRQVSKVIQERLDGCQFTSTKIRYLTALNWSQGDIARKLGKRPQHVSNVLNQKVTKPLEAMPSLK